MWQLLLRSMWFANGKVGFLKKKIVQNIPEFQYACFTSNIFIFVTSCISGGSSLFIETTQSKPLSEEKKFEGSLQLSGHLGDVMKESANIAYTFAKTFMLEEHPTNDFLFRAHLHLHVPEVFLCF